MKLQLYLPDIVETDRINPHLILERAHNIDKVIIAAENAFPIVTVVVPDDKKTTELCRENANAEVFSFASSDMAGEMAKTRALTARTNPA